MEDIKDKIEVIFEALGETAKNKADKVDKTELLELSAKEVVRMDLFTIPTIWEPMAAVSKLNFKVVNFFNELIFAT